MTQRSPAIAAILSGLFPGLGQLYNGERIKALAFIVAGLVTAFGPFSPVDVAIDLDNPVAGLRHALPAALLFLILALWSTIGAYRVARRQRTDTST